VPDFARRLAAALSLPFETVLEKTDNRAEQKTMANSTQQARNIDGSLAISAQELRVGPLLLVDDMVDSRWTLTVAAWLLRSQGSGEVLPIALAQAGTTNEQFTFTQHPGNPVADRPLIAERRDSSSDLLKPAEYKRLVRFLRDKQQEPPICLFPTRGNCLRTANS